MKKLIKITLLFIIISLLFTLSLTIIGCKNINELIQNLNSDNDEICADAENALIRIGEPSIEPLIEILKDKGNPARASVVKILGKIGNGSAIKPLIDCLTEPGEYSIKDKKTVELLIDVSGEKPPEMPEAPKATEMGEIPETTEVIPSIETDINENATNTGISSDTFPDNQYPVLVEVVHALSLLCKDSENEKIIADEINKIDIAFVMVAYPYLIEIGASGTEDMLINALNIYGFSMMAEDFINSGNEKLEVAARDWAKKNNYTIYEMPGFGGKEWGSGKD
jgi:hypothetical protein